ncbi:DUF917 domain-containing protein [Streptosporangium sp. CA-135522]|uniref:DUF917 domain-containing protein n=1 Tax=Streptosporangium sp. CA-135522 TaxID=3240072 RepID=UPI003D93AF73
MDIDIELLPAYARGCAVLGSGGGGSVAMMRAVAQQALEEHGPVRVVQPEELDPDVLVMPCGSAGTSAVQLERIGGRGEPAYLRAEVEKSHGGRVGALMPSEIGGANGCVAVAWAAYLGLPLVDADGMGRAFPRMDQTAMELHGISPTPAVLCDERGRTVVIDHVDGRWLERLVRVSLEAFGGQVASSEYVLRAGQVRTCTVTGSVTRAVEIGENLPGPLVTGKVTAVEDGSILVEGLGPDAGRLVRIEAQSEYLAVFEDGRLLAAVPDVIALLDTRGGETVQVEQLRYGLRVGVVHLECAPVWRTPAGLRLGGPEAFGLSGLPRPPLPCDPAAPPAAPSSGRSSGRSSAPSSAPSSRPEAQR